MVANIPAHTRVVVLGEGDVPAFSGVLIDPPTTYGDMYQIRPDQAEFPSLMLAPIELVHPEPPPDNPVFSVTEAIHQAARQDARDELQQTIATLRRIGLSEKSIMALFLEAMKKDENS
jgi:hypothetical protein